MPFLVVDLAARELVDGCTREIPEAVGVEVVERHADQAAAGNEAGTRQVQQPRDQLAAREVAGRAEQHDHLRKTRTDASGDFCHAPSFAWPNARWHYVLDKQRSRGPHRTRVVRAPWACTIAAVFPGAAPSRRGRRGGGLPTSAPLPPRSRSARKVRADRSASPCPWSRTPRNTRWPGAVWYRASTRASPRVPARRRCAC